MLKSEQRSNAPITSQISFWNAWNAEAREAGVEQVSIDQASVVRSWLLSLGRSDLDILDVGCGTGWLCNQLTQFGRVTGIDLADEVLARAARRMPTVKFVSGNFSTMELERESYDAVVSLEVLSHVADQRAFLGRVDDMLVPGGHLMLATQNRPQLERNDIPPPAPGQIRNWADRHALATLLRERFEVLELFSVTPQFNRGPLRYLNSGRLRSLLLGARLGRVHALLKVGQERAWLGWTLMALARKPAS